MGLKKRHILAVVLWLILIFALSFVGICADKAWIRYVVAEKEAVRNPHRDYEFVDIKVGCECGNQMVIGFPIQPGCSWPVVFTCQDCRAKYVLSKTRIEDSSKKIETHRDILVIEDAVTSEVIFIEHLDPGWNVRYDKDNGVLYCDFGYEGKWLAFR